LASAHPKVITLLDFTLTPVTGGEAFFPDDPEHALLGISPWNGKYKPAYIEALVGWACSRFPRVDVLVPGYEAAHTLIAAGWAPRTAVRRAKRAIRQLRKPALHALSQAGLQEPHKHVHTWTQMLANTPYTATLRRVRTAYRSDRATRRVCRDNARNTIRHLSGREPDPAQLDLAVSYPIAELPMVIDAPRIFGVASSVFIYHRDMELIHPFVNSDSTALTPGAGQSYAIATPTKEDDR
jgi:cyclo(L-tyrosyl-L-tyrosyl) synthase